MEYKNRVFSAAELLDIDGGTFVNCATETKERLYLKKDAFLDDCNFQNLSILGHVAINRSKIGSLYTSERSSLIYHKDIPCQVTTKTDVQQAYLHGYAELTGGIFDKLLIGPEGSVKIGFVSHICRLEISGCAAFTASGTSDVIERIVLNPGGKLICLNSSEDDRILKRVECIDGRKPYKFGSWICG